MIAKERLPALQWPCLGAFTYVNQQNAAEEIVAASAITPEAKVRCWQLDVRVSADVERVADEVLSAFGRVDAVVPNAGINLNAPAWSTSDNDWHTVIQT
jgi:NAD(P)-dependent dehydrogenase (short-subunit alcohol dehydrogenase family)